MNIRNYRMTFSRLFCALIIAAAPAASFASVSAGVSIDVAPPPLPVYVQPPCPAPGFLWMPGYWARHVGFYGGVDYGFGYPGSALSEASGSVACIATTPRW